MTLIFLSATTVLSVVKNASPRRALSGHGGFGYICHDGNKRTHATLFKTGSCCGHFSKTRAT